MTSTKYSLTDGYGNSLDIYDDTSGPFALIMNMHGSGDPNVFYIGKEDLIEFLESALTKLKA